MGRYSSASVTLHWLMVLLFAGIYLAANVIDVFPEDSERQHWAKTLHFSLGLSVLFLVWLRMILRLASTTPPVLPAPPVWQMRLAQGLHAGLYLLMVLMPVLGWAALSAYGEPVPYFAWHLPALIAQNKALAETILEIHEWGGNLGYFLIGAHAVAALVHHNVFKDNTLRRMRLK